MSDLIRIGIDAGKTHHHAAAVAGDGRLIWSQRVANDQAAVEGLIERGRRSGTELLWAVDLTSSAAALLVALLLAAGQRVVYVPGRTVNRMADAFAGEGKTDAKDARVIAETARMHHHGLAELSTPDELVVELSRLVAHREDLMADWVRGINRLRDLLTGIFPALERCFDYSTRSPLILLAGFCTPAAIRQAGATTLTDHLRRSGASRPGIPAMVSKALAAAAAQSVQLPGEATTAALITRLAGRLLDLHREIKDLDRLLTERFRTHRQAAIIESLPGMGPILGAEFIVTTGGDLAAFATPARLAAYAGLAPVPNDSGRRTGNLHRPTRYDRRLRRVFYLAAFSSLKTEGPSRVFYQRKRAERRRHTHALIALARRLVDVLWALLRDNRPFQLSAPTRTAAA